MNTCSYPVGCLGLGMLSFVEVVALAESVRDGKLFMIIVVQHPTWNMIAVIRGAVLDFAFSNSYSYITSRALFIPSTHQKELRTQDHSLPSTSTRAKNLTISYIKHLSLTCPRHAP